MRFILSNGTATRPLPLPDQHSLGMIRGRQRSNLCPKKRERHKRNKWHTSIRENGSCAKSCGLAQAYVINMKLRLYSQIARIKTAFAPNGPEESRSP